MNGSLDTLDFKRGFRNPFSALKHPILPHQRSQGNQIYPLNFSGENLFGWYLHKANFFINAYIYIYVYIHVTYTHTYETKASISESGRLTWCLDVWMLFKASVWTFMCLGCGRCLWNPVRGVQMKWNFDEFCVCFLLGVDLQMWFSLIEEYRAFPVWK